MVIKKRKTKATAKKVKVKPLKYIKKSSTSKKYKIGKSAIKKSSKKVLKKNLPLLKKLSKL